MQIDKNDKLTFWRRKLQEYLRSGLSRRVFSEQNGVSKSKLDYWFARIHKGQKAKGLVEMKPAPILIHECSLQVVVAGKYRIEVHSGFDPVLFGEVVKVLGSVQ